MVTAWEQLLALPWPACSGWACCFKHLVTTFSCTKRRAGFETYGQTPSSSAPADETVDWRRSIYTRDMWALPVTVLGGGGTPPPNAAMPAGEQRLQDWVARELLALLQQEVTRQHVHVCLTASCCMAAINSLRNGCNSYLCADTCIS
jgi:hypothetical protein